MNSRGGAPRSVGFPPGHLRESGASLFTHQRISPPANAAHVIDRNLYLLRAVGSETTERAFPIAVPEAIRTRANQGLMSCGLTEFVALNPGGGWPTKRWAPERDGRLAVVIPREWSGPRSGRRGPGAEPG